MAQAPSRGIRILAIVLGVVIIASGVSKLVGEPHQVTMFTQVGLPRWFLALVGTFEVIGGILLAAPPFTPIGSLILSTIMVGALWTHVAQRESMELAPVGVLLALFLLIFQRSRSRVIRLIEAA